MPFHHIAAPISPPPAHGRGLNSILRCRSNSRAYWAASGMIAICASSAMIIMVSRASGRAHLVRCDRLQHISGASWPHSHQGYPRLLCCEISSKSLAVRPHHKTSRGGGGIGDGGHSANSLHMRCGGSLGQDGRTALDANSPIPCQRRSWHRSCVGLFNLTSTHLG